MGKMQTRRLKGKKDGNPAPLLGGMVGNACSYNGLKGLQIFV